MVEVLEERKFPVGELQLFASERSAGEMIAFQDEDHPIQILTKEAFYGVAIALFSRGRRSAGSTRLSRPGPGRL